MEMSGQLHAPAAMISGKKFSGSYYTRIGSCVALKARLNSYPCNRP
jgi:hypothetical protein